ncbi:MAG: tail fiber domain-containing protein [Pyrinomonadaceae bacterium]
MSNTVGDYNTFIGRVAGSQNTTGDSNTFIGSGAGNPNTSTQVNDSTAIGVNAAVSTSNTIVLGTTAENTRIPGLLNVSDTGGGNFRFRVVISAAGGGVVAPQFYLPSFPQGPSGIPLCWKAAADGVAANIITNCISFLSSEKVKTDVKPFSGGLDVIKRLKPITFNWKSDGKSGIGLNAEDAAEAAPDLVTRNAKGEVEELKGHSLNLLFINAIKEQQSQIDAQQQSIQKLQQQVNALKKIVCVANPQTEICTD